MKRNLIILGAGDVGSFICYNLDQFSNDYTQVYVLDDDARLWNSERGEYKIAGPISTITHYLSENTHVVIGIAEPQIKEDIIKRLVNLNLTFPSLISKFAWVSNGVTIEKGAIIYPGVTINHGSVIERFSLLNMNCAIGHNTRIGAFSFLAPGVCTGGFTKLGKKVKMGINSSTLPRVHVANKTIVGGNALVTNNTSTGQTVVGIPARDINLKNK